MDMDTCLNTEEQYLNIIAKTMTELDYKVLTEVDFNQPSDPEDLLDITIREGIDFEQILNAWSVMDRMQYIIECEDGWFLSNTGVGLRYLYKKLHGMNITDRGADNE